MDSRLSAARKSQLLLLFSCVIGLSFATRLVLFITNFPMIDASFLDWIAIFGLGLVYDFINACYFSIPLVIYLWVTPRSAYNKTWHTWFRAGLLFIMIGLLVFNAAAEWLFWDEFNVRFNFIAVDYLVYTNEVLGNIQQSYPIVPIMAGILIATTILITLSFRIISAKEFAVHTFRNRSAFVLFYAVFIALISFTTSSRYHRYSGNAVNNELASNGMYELFAAYLHNELDYHQFYTHIDDRQSFDILRKLVKTDESTFSSDSPYSIERQISNGGAERNMNVVLISVESFSADFMTRFGNTEHITPFLDSLSAHSLLFTQLYATGTRTVRGLEALSLCVPPTPGQSIVRRPHNEDLFTLGKVFREKGYDCKYIYGGYSYFDNMGYYFGNNHYDVVDRSELAQNEIDYENIWGVADENLFTLAIRQLDANTKNEKVFAHIMTTSNHRPFTYPEGRIDIPSHTGRSGAVKYTDYAIGQFFKEAAKHPWFSNTIFVVVADHCASSAGKTDLPIEKYHIPMLIYAPGIVQPGEMNRLMSQIDIGPTLLGLLNFSYKSKFYGYDMFHLEPGRERAFISTYQTLGYLKGDKMVVLSPQQKAEVHQISNGVVGAGNVKDPQLLNEAVAWYQSASYSFRHHLMN
jgi:phosphoglycerol transferase MdoB-like AlkP superfamily enzyme